MLRNLFTVIICSLSLATSFVFGNCKSACATGDWEVGSTWSASGMPGCGDTIVIPAGTKVTITTQLDYYSSCTAPMYIAVYGELHFQTGKKLMLPCNSTVYIASGGKMTAGTGGGSSDYLEICGVIVWDAGDGPVYGERTFFVGSLPIELISFDAVSSGRQIALNWQTATESQNNFFTVERSKDGINFEFVAKIKGAGTSEVIQSYSCYDANPRSGASYYRLKQTDYDGTYKYSQIVTVSFADETDALIFPNPNSGSFSLKFDTKKENGEGEVKISTSSGKLLYSFMQPNDMSHYELPLEAGVYFMEIVNASQTIKRKFVVEK